MSIKRYIILGIYLLLCLVQPAEGALPFLRGLAPKARATCCRVKHQLRVSPVVRWVKTNPIKATGLAVAAYVNYKDAVKDRYLVKDITDAKTMQPLDDLTHAMSKLSMNDKAAKDPLDLRRSRTCKEIYQLMGVSMTESNPEQYRYLIGQLIKKYYRSGLLNHMMLMPSSIHQITEMIVQFSRNEAQVADTHYALYYGSNRVLSLILRTALYARQHHVDVGNYAILRDAAEKDAGSLQDLVTTAKKRNKDKPADVDSDVRSAMISANLSPVGNSVAARWTDGMPIGPLLDTISPYNAYYGENSMAFIMQNGLDGVNWQRMHGIYGAWITRPIIYARNLIWNELLGQRDSEAEGPSDRELCNAILGSKYKMNLRQKIAMWQHSLYPTGVLMQILVPKAMVQEKDVQLASMWGDYLHGDARNALEGGVIRNDDQLRVILRPEWFRNPGSGVVVNTVMYGQGSVLRSMIQSCCTLADEVVAQK